MAKIGSLGGIVFEVSSKKNYTFKDFSRSGSARWNEHEIIASKPISEFLGADLEEITFTIILKAEFGVNPLKQLEIMRKIRDTGKTAPFVLGGKPLSINHWSIRQISETHKTVDNKGNVLNVEATLTLKEYVIRKKKNSSKPKPVVKGTTTTTKSKN
ncbi:phage tail protein [Psychrobacillus sp. FSL K6-1267]|uniref:phage tail protein n=1 Tax=Psychrobacillus sp. FSL K6-1267 TaxID=2921543 RepID=UPI0030F5AFAC